MKLLFRDKTSLSDKPKYSEDFSFRDFLFDTKIITYKIYFEYSFKLTKFWQNKRL